MTVQGVRGEQLLSHGERFAPEPGLFARLVAPGFSKIIDRVDAGLERGTMIAHLPDGTIRQMRVNSVTQTVQVFSKPKARPNSTVSAV